MHEINIEETRTEFVALVERAIGGEEVVILRETRPVAKIVPIASTLPSPRFGSAKGLIEIADDFDAPLEDFREYM